MNVTAAPGLKVPTEHNAREYITETEVRDVPLSAYYIRRLKDGDLVEVPDAVEQPAAKPTQKRIVKGAA